MAARQCPWCYYQVDAGGGRVRPINGQPPAEFGQSGDTEEIVCNPCGMSGIEARLMFVRDSYQRGDRWYAEDVTRCKVVAVRLETTWL